MPSSQNAALMEALRDIVDAHWSAENAHDVAIEMQRVARVAIASPAPQAEEAAIAQPAMTKETELSKRLRAAMTANGLISKADTLAAVDEIERYYGGMLAWKATAEAKDKELAAIAQTRERIRNEALIDAEDAVTALYEQEEKPYLVDICRAIISLQSQPASAGKENGNAG